MPNLAAEIEFSRLFHQTILPDVSILLTALTDIAEKEFTGGKIDSGFDVMVKAIRGIRGFLAGDINTKDKMPSRTEEYIFLPQIAGKLARMVSARPSFRTSDDAHLLSFKIHLAVSSTWLMDSSFPSLPFQEKHKEFIGKACADGISAYLKDFGIDQKRTGGIDVISQIGMKVRSGDIDPLELADMALMSSLVSHYNSSADNLYPAIRKIQSSDFPLGNNFIGTLLKDLHSPLAKYFPITGFSAAAN